jgi:RNA polymerase sigma-70 factor (ECF subfamily)
VPQERGLGSDQGDENTIIAQCLAGDRKAYAVLVERYKDLVHDLVYRMIGDAVRAEDIAQDAFINAYLSLRDFRGESRFSTWLCRIAMNRCKDMLRRARREVLMPGGPDGETHIPDSVDEGETPAATLERREREAVLRRALARLPLKYREAVVLRHMEGMDFKEVGGLLGIAAGAAKVRTFRGREMLRKLLEREGFRDDAI